MPVNLDWTRDPVPPKITKFQQFIRDVDWSKTSLGPMETWQRELRQMARFIQANTSPIVLYWGPQHTIMYNEAYIPLVHEKHPWMMGRNAPDVFPEFWSEFEEVIAKQREDGLTGSGEASLLLMERTPGFLEETYFDWKLIPVIGDNGQHLGSYGMPSDNTKFVIGQRRTKCVQLLSRKVTEAKNFRALWDAIICGLLENDKDVPFALLLADEDFLTSHGTPVLGHTGELKVVASIGLPEGHKLKDMALGVEGDDNDLMSAVRKVSNDGKIAVVTADSLNFEQYFEGVEWRGSGVPCKQFAILPIFTGSKTPAVLVTGINPYRRYNDWYRDFLVHCTNVVSAQLSSLRLSEELKYRAELASRAVKDFERSESRFERYAARSTAGFAVASREARLIYANDTWCHLHGVPPGQARGVEWSDTIHADEDISVLEEWLYKVIVLKQSVSFQYRTKVPWKKDNMEMSYTTAYATCYADLDENGEVETVMGFVVDVSEQKWIESQLLQRSQELGESEQKYRKFADLCPFGIVSTDEHGVVQWGNDSWHKFYGFEKGNVPDPQPWLPHVHEEDYEKTKNFFANLRKFPGSRSIELRRKKRYVVYEGDRMIENDGWALVVGTQEYKDNAQTQIDSIDFWVIDISAQKMAEKVLTDKMEEAIRTRTAQEHFIDMISHEIRNPLSAVLHCADEIIDSTKTTLADSVSTPSNGLLPVRRAPTSGKLRQKMMHNILDAANTIVWCTNHQKQIVDDVLTLSKLDSELLVVSPTPVKLSELMQSALKIFEPELRMSDISLEMIEHDSVRQQRADWILLDSNRFLQILINLVTNAIKFTRGASENRKIKIVTSVHKERPCHFEELDFVPRRYSPLERRESSLGLEIQQSDQIYLRISVSDTGKGLTTEEKKMLFNRFAQASPKTHVEYGGSGLGLFISRQITEMLGGEIGVGVSSSGGCTFAFYVATSKIDAPPTPYLQPTIAPPTSRTHSAPSSTFPTTKDTVAISPPTVEKRKILVVEDNIVNQKVLCKQLRNRGFEVEASNHGKEALTALEKAQASELGYFNVVLCDIEMPIMDGIECVKEIRSRENVGILPKHVPVIGVTANVRSKQVDAAVEAGMDGVTTKPYRLDDLIAHMDRLVVSSASSDGLKS